LHDNVLSLGVAELDLDRGLVLPVLDELAHLLGTAEDLSPKRKERERKATSVLRITGDSATRTYAHTRHTMAEQTACTYARHTAQSQSETAHDGRLAASIGTHDHVKPRPGTDLVPGKRYATGER
jgi:hypothetical protein